MNVRIPDRWGRTEEARRQRRLEREAAIRAEAGQPSQPIEADTSGTRPQESASSYADVLRESVSHLVDVHRSLEAAEACLPSVIDPRGVGDLLTMLGATNAAMAVLMASVREGMSLPPELVDEAGLPENERASEIASYVEHASATSTEVPDWVNNPAPGQAGQAERWLDEHGF